MKYQKNNLKVLVATASTSAAETTLKAFKSGASAGEIRAFTPTGGAISGAVDRFIIALKKSDGTIDVTEPIVSSAASGKAKAVSYSAGTEQIGYVGFDGSTGDIDVINSNLYQLNLTLKDYVMISNDHWYVKHGHYKTAASGDTQATIATGLTQSLARNFSREPFQVLKFEMLVNNAGAAVTGTGNLTVTNGQVWVEAATDADAVVSVGDFIRIGGTAVTDPVYRIEAIDATNDRIKLSHPYQGASGTVVEASVEYVTAALAATADFGIKITGVPQRFDKEKFLYNKVRFVIDLVEFGTTDLDAVAVAASLGVGEAEAVSQTEAFAEGNFGEYYRTGEPLLFSPALETDMTLNYDIITLPFETEEKGFLINPTNPRTIEVAINAAASGGNLITDLNNAMGLSLSV